MPVPTDTRLAFGARLRAARKRHYASATAFAIALSERGVEVTSATVTGWERGEWTPPYDALLVIEQLLDTQGELLALLGYQSADGLAELRGEVASLRGEIAELRAQMTRFADLLRRLGPDTLRDAGPTTPSGRRKRS